MAHVAQWKYKEVDNLTAMLTEHKIVGIAEIGGIPAPQMQQMRANLHDVAFLRSAKNSLIFRALDEAEKKVQGIGGLKESIRGQTAIIATDMNPFRLYGRIKATRTKAPAKGGETATYNIEVKAGDTPFKPGPIVGELQKAGIPAAIEGGKVVIKKDKVVVAAGEKFTKDIAQMLARLEIFPLDIGMSLHAVFEDGTIFKPDVLDIDIDVFRTRLQEASRYAFNLAVEAAWINNQTIMPLLQKAHRNAFGVAIEGGILNKETTSHLLSKAYRSMLSLASQIKDGIDEELKNLVS
jgi:large subunit ribosomal protein L10